MKKKIVLWGHDENDKKILLALALQEQENKVHIHTFSEDKVSEQFYNDMMDKWRSGAEVEFPEGYETIIRELSVTDDILPETIKVQRTDLITRAKSEWHFVVLSTKLYDLYSTELADFKSKIEALLDFDNEIWDEIRGFWSKITEQSRERNLFREHADKLRDGTNELFGTMKELKSKANEKLAGVSKEHVTTFSARLNEVKEKAEKGMSLGPLFDELKKIQHEFKDADFTRNDRSKVWKRIDEAFKLVKEKKYGKQPEGQQGGAVSRLERRYQGLKSAIGKMKASIKRDQNDIDFHNSRNNKPSGQLEMQLREAKIQMIKGRMDSKQEKLDEMLSTQTDLEKKMEKEKAREIKKEEKRAIDKKKAELRKQVDAAVSDQAELSPEEAKKLELAAASMNKKKKGANKDAPAAADAGSEAKSAGSEAKSVGTEDKAAIAASTDSSVETANEDPVAAKAEAAATEAEATIEEAKATNKEAKVALQESKGETAAKAEEKGSSVAENIGKGGLLAGAIALGAKLMDKVEDVADDIVEKVGLDDTIDKAKTTLKKTEEAVKEKAAVVSEKVDLKGKAEKAKAAVADTKAKVAEKGNEAKESIKAEAKDAKSAAKEKVADAKETTKETVKEAKESATEKVAEAKETAKDAKEATENKMGETLAKGGLLGAAVALGSKFAGSISDKLEDVADSVGMGDAFDSAKEAMGDLKDKAAEGLESAKESVSEMSDKAVEKAGEIKDQVADKAGEVKEKAAEVKDKVADKAGEVKEKAGEVKDKVADKAGAAKDKVADKADGAKADTSADGDAKENKMGESLAKGGLLGAAVALGSKLAGSITEKIEDLTEATTESVDSVADRVRAEGKDVVPGSDKAAKGKGEEE